MELQGKIIVVLPERSGTSQRGNQWRSITYVLETQEQYPKKLAFDVTNDKIDQLNIQFGEILTVQFDINAREYQGRYFNSVQAWNVIRQTQQAPAQGGGFSGNVQSGAQAAQQSMASSANANGVANPMNPQNPYPPRQQPAQPQGDSDDLPF
nr:MAG TPA: protein of unknown function DUF3127 [Caudoviricetes sp.]